MVRGKGVYTVFIVHRSYVCSLIPGLALGGLLFIYMYFYGRDLD